MFVTFSFANRMKLVEPTRLHAVDDYRRMEIVFGWRLRFFCGSWNLRACLRLASLVTCFCQTGSH